MGPIATQVVRDVEVFPRFVEVKEVDDDMFDIFLQTSHKLL